MPTKSKRRSDGTLRPSIVRYRARKRDAQRKEWLARFAPGARKRFFRMADIEYAVWLKPAARKLGMPQEQAAKLLEQIAEEKRWMKLRLADGMVVGIAPPRNAKEAP